MQALALKYRPKSFYELIGQDAIKENLISALDSGRLGHAYLFSGLRGSGKTSSARIFAKNLLCERGISSHACEVCESCVAANEGRHIDIIEMDAASHRKIEDIRDLNEQTRYSPVSGRFKIFIIDEAHMLTKEASNAFLKTLEEPPAYIKFILATTDPLKLPATILSRTQHFRFKAISPELILKHLEEILAKENISFETDALRILARSGSGSLRDTLTLLDQAIITCNANITTSAVTEMLGILDPSKIEEILNITTRGSNEELCELIKNLAANDAEMIINELIENLKEKFISKSPSFSLLIFERFFKILSEAKNMLGGGSDPAFVLYITLFEMKECFVLKPQNEFFEPKNFASQNFTSQNFSTHNNQNPIQKTQISSTQNNELKNSANQSEPNSQNSLNNEQKYKNFLNFIYERSFDLGKLFDNFIEFISFDGEQITLLSKAQGMDAQKLKNNSKFIRETTFKAFGVDKIKIKKQEPIKAEAMLEKIIQNTEQMDVNSQNPENSQILENSKNSTLPQESAQELAPELAPVPKAENSKSYSQTNASIIELNSLFGEPEIIKS